MKRQLFLGLAFSVLAVNAFAATSAQPVAAHTQQAVAEGGSDRLLERRVAEGGSD
ncbi:hypothetical protein HX782_17555, partial [Pseudomonas gingeri]|nr:hypothetical protein [Pseudomonas gingeri]NWA15468.1 hypothetical protein [Pseudomonas gingeri]NWA56695.1 hypothetical protein [Pseudomonas gingeri]NWA95189.1 hypothetical protein [Pseudomonas gingeri]NWC33221.1 hypothetical protein [Pseudomonas gingeri]